MKAKDVMHCITDFLTPEQDALSAWEIIRGLNIHALPVLREDGSVVGLLTRNHIFKAGPQVTEKPLIVSDIMGSNYRIVNKEMALLQIWMMHEEQFIVTNDDGNIVGIIDRKDICPPLFDLANRMLLQLEIMLDSAHNGIVAVDKNGIVTIFNKAAERITRRPKRHAIGKHLSDVVIPQGLLKIIEEGKKQSQYKFQVDYSKGSHTYLTNRTPILENKQVVGAVGVFQDISEFEFISAELNSVKELNEELECIIKSSFDGIVITDIDGKILKDNKAHQRITNTGDIQGKAMDDLVREGIYSVPIIEAVVEKENSVTYMEKTRGGNHLLVTGNPVKNERGEIFRVVINVRDITELSNLQDKLQYSKELSERYQLELTQLQNRIFKGQELVFVSVKMKRLVNVALRVAQVDSTVLLLGESGTGKGVMAKIIHSNSSRKKGPFVTINCGAIPENLLESELFGYEKGAFTGAKREGKIGLFELANDGTLFLDEIGDLPLPFQVKILRSIQEREITRVGGTATRPINVRIIAATNQNLSNLVSEGSFREDLYFRLNVVPLKVLPLRKRREDIVPLIYMFNRKFSKAYHIKKDFAPGVIDALLDYHWPGNVRELENVIERLMVTSPERLITEADLPRHLFKKAKGVFPEVTITGILPLRQAVLELERQLLGKAIGEHGSTYKVAEVLDINQSTVVRKVNRLKKMGYKLDR